MEAELRGQCDKLIDRLLHAFDYMDPVDSDYARQVAREIASGLSDTIAAQAAELALAKDGWHMANGVAELAMKHRDEAEAELEGLRKVIADAPVAEVVENNGYTYVHKFYAPAPASMLKKRVRLVPDTALADSDAGGG